MAIGVTARTSFSLLLPPLIDEFGWERGLAAGAFSFGFLVSARAEPDRRPRHGPHGPAHRDRERRRALMAAGLLLATVIAEPWQLYATLGVMVGAGANLMTFTAHSLFLPNWFVRRRGLAISIAFSGVGVGAIVLLPWLQSIIERDGWRAACWAHGAARARAAGAAQPAGAAAAAGHRPAARRRIACRRRRRRAPRRTSSIAAWASIDWTLARALRTGRFWWIALGYFCALFAWYAVQVHQTKYLIEVGFSPIVAAWALGIVSVVAIPGQIGLGAPVGPHRPRMDMDGGLRSASPSATPPDRAGGTRRRRCCSG